MKKQYKLLDVVHSGRKGIRGYTVTDTKYNGIIGCHCSFDIDDIQQFCPLTLTVINSCFYDWWRTSEVIGAIETNGTLLLETLNSIYKFKELDNE